MNIRRAFAMAAAALLLALVAAFEVTAAEPAAAPYIEVTAEGEAKVPPDLATLDFGVTTRADTAAAAVQENAARMKAVLAAVRAALGPKAQIGTGTYTLRAEYSTPRDGTPARPTGYSASNVVRLETADLARVGELIDVAAKAGSNQVQRIAFGVSDSATPRRRALSEAVAHARDDAETIAAAMKARLGTVQWVVLQDTGPVRPFMQDAVMMRAEAAPTTPIEPGLVPVRARVLVRFELAR